VSQRAQLRWYMGGLAAWFVGSGAQGTLFPWLVAVALAESALRVGAAQTAAMLPALVLMLVGGAVADRSDGRRLLVGLHAAAVLPPLALAIALARGHGSYAAVVAWAVAMGVISALAIPARDALLSRVTGADVQRAVTVSIMLQVSAQIVGTLVAGTADFWGGSTVLFAQAAANGIGALLCSRLAPAPPTAPAHPSRGRLADIREGFETLVRTPQLLPVTLLSTSIGLLFLGGFLVAMPLVVRDVYAGSSVEIAGANGAMMLGMFAGSSALLARGGLRRQGRALLLALASGAVALGAVSLGPPLPVVYALVFVFGVSGGVAMPAGRALVQEAAPASHRARVLSVYSLGFMGSAPLGAFAMGGLVDALGPLAAMLVPAGAMLCVVAAALLASDTWHFRTRGAVPEDAPG